MSVYRKFDVNPVVNATGSVTRLGGALMPSEGFEALIQGALVQALETDVQLMSSEGLHSQRTKRELVEIGGLLSQSHPSADRALPHRLLANQTAVVWTSGRVA